MKNMKYLLFALSLAFGFGMLSKSHSDMLPDPMTPTGMSYVVCTGSKTIFNGQGTLYRIDLGTGNGVDFAQLFDSATASNGLNFTALQQSESTQAVTVPLQFQYSTATVSGQVLSAGYRDYSPYGVFIKNGLYFYTNKTDVNGINRAAVYYRK